MYSPTSLIRILNILSLSLCICAWTECVILPQKHYSYFGLARYPILSKTMIDIWAFSEQDLSSDPPKLQKIPPKPNFSEFYVVPKQFATDFVAATRGDLLQFREDAHWLCSTTYNVDGDIIFDGVHYLLTPFRWLQISSVPLSFSYFLRDQYG